MASVWRAMDTRLGVERAIKVLKPHLNTANTNARARFEREARLMASLEHPNITPVHDVGEDSGAVWIVMSLVGGGSLADHLKAYGTLPPRQACDVCLGVLRALVAAHGRGVIHRDIKPHNVLLDRDGVVRLADFGIARVTEADGLTQTGAVMGTWAYMAPEQRLSANRADPRSDVYAVGALLAALITGIEPFDLHNPQSHDGQLGAVPIPMRRFIVACTAYRPEDRIQSAQEALQRLESLRGSLPTDPANTPELGTASRSASSAGALATLPSQTTGGDDPHSAAVTRPTLWLWVGVGGASMALVAGVGVVLLLAGPLALWLGGWLDDPRPGADLPGGVAVPDPDPEAIPADAPQPVDAPIPDPPAPEPPAPEPPDPDPPAPVVERSPPPPDPVPTARPEPEPDAEVPVPAKGTLSVSSRPWSRVEIDGESVGNTPWQGRIVQGSHRVTLIREGQSPIVRTLTVGDEATVFCWDYAEEAPCLRLP